MVFGGDFPDLKQRAEKNRVYDFDDKTWTTFWGFPFEFIGSITWPTLIRHSGTLYAAFYHPPEVENKIWSHSGEPEDDWKAEVVLQDSNGRIIIIPYE